MEHDDRCTVTWCQEGTRPHTDHQEVLGTWFGEEPDTEHGMTAQVSIYGSADDPQAVLVLVDPQLRRRSCMLDWESAIQLAVQIIGAWGRLRRVEG